MTVPPAGGDDFVQDAGLAREQVVDASDSESRTSRLDRPMKMDHKAPGAPKVSTYYDQFMYDGVIDDYFGHSDFYNFGIWRDGTDAPSDACRALIAELVALDPRIPLGYRGRVRKGRDHKSAARALAGCRDHSN